jgi:hypothetical protein
VKRTTRNRKSKAEGGCRGQKEDAKRNAAIMDMLRRRDSWNHIIAAATGCSRSTLSRLGQQVKRDAFADK